MKKAFVNIEVQLNINLDGKEVSDEIFERLQECVGEPIYDGQQLTEEQEEVLGWFYANVTMDEALNYTIEINAVEEQS